MFLELLESEYDALCEIDDECIQFYAESCDTVEDVDELVEALGLDDEVATILKEDIVKRVDSKGTVTRTMSKKVRSRRAAFTTGLSKSQLKIRARKAARTKKKNPMITVRAIRKRRKALRRRKQMGIK